ncbi:membrane-bound lytic murein transglycosylase B [Nocardioides zeae]|uniref:Membrane-bound lytic murein transglycosylase B n=2 Tax=Nocardioides zeae TaxID=1457234 RepID=A0ACC6IF49_9ACTN|nr:lytic transglycosylase domain-containing protein [Nocardioides zeae]MDR6209373.1 membrane-bound lytic murein transglycosylase B [Nocardioides zeae]
MSNSKFARWQKATALAPMAALSAAATVVVAGSGGPVGTLTAADDTVTEGAIAVPTDAVETPASVSVPDAVTPTSDPQIVSASSTSGIPAVALGAYQRAQTIINGADTSCRISWQLIAAIGRVESDHGRFGGGQLSDEGIATPGIFGIPLDGTNGTSRILDTDAGELDNDATYDRAVGPMQFIPSTWRVIRVDANGDGVRDPQNIHDAALGTAVYLCSGTEDLSTEAGKRAAVLRYNRSEEYVNLVLAIEQAYLDGEYTSVPNAVASSNYFVPDPVRVQPGGSTDSADPGTSGGSGNGSTPGSTPGSGGSGSTGGSTPGTGGGSSGGSGGSDGGSSTPGTGGGSTGGDTPVVPTPTPTPTPSEPKDGGLADLPTDPVGTVGGVVTDPVGTVGNTLTWLQASVSCNAQGKFDNPFKTNDPWDLCMKALGY